MKTMLDVGVGDVMEKKSVEEKEEEEEEDCGGRSGLLCHLVAKVMLEIQVTPRT